MGWSWFLVKMYIGVLVEGQLIRKCIYTHGSEQREVRVLSDTVVDPTL